MWFQKNNRFVYFFFNELSCISNKFGVFANQFGVKEENKLQWANSGKAKELAPELITCWSKDNAL